MILRIKRTPPFWLQLLSRILLLLLLLLLLLPKRSDACTDNDEDLENIHYVEETCFSLGPFKAYNVCNSEGDMICSFFPRFRREYTYEQCSQRPRSRGSSSDSTSLCDVCQTDNDCSIGQCSTDGKCVCKAIQKSNATGITPISIVFVGSGFATDDDNNVFSQKVNEIVQYFRNFHMFDEETINQLNLLYVNVPMVDSYCNYHAEMDRFLECNINTAHTLTELCVPTGPNTQTIVIHNDNTRYGGAGYSRWNVATVSTIPTFAKIVTHELGHSMFDLVDEYKGPEEPIRGQEQQQQQQQECINGNESNKCNRGPNCDPTYDCTKWKDMIGYDFQGIYNPVECLRGYCKGSDSNIGELSLMQNLKDGTEFGAVNERYTCCTYLAFTGSVPPYCNLFEFTPGYLLNYCQANDYQGYGKEVYNKNQHDFLRRGMQKQKESSNWENYKFMGQTAVKVRIVLEQDTPRVTTIRPAPEGLYRKEEVILHPNQRRRQQQQQQHGDDEDLGLLVGNGDWIKVTVLRTHGEDSTSRFFPRYSTAHIPSILLENADEYDDNQIDHQEGLVPSTSSSSHIQVQIDFLDIIVDQHETILEIQATYN